MLSRLKIGGCATTVTYCLSYRARHPRSANTPPPSAVHPLLQTVNTASSRRSAPELSSPHPDQVAHLVTGPPPVLCLRGRASSKARRRQCPVRGRRRAAHKIPASSNQLRPEQCLPNRLLLPPQTLCTATRKYLADLGPVQPQAREAEDTDHSSSKMEDRMGLGKRSPEEACPLRMLDREVLSRRLRLEM